MNADRPVLGIFLMLGFCIVAPMGDATAKLLGTRLPIGELLLIRFALQGVFLTPIALATGRVMRMRGYILRMTALRTLLHILGVGFMFTSLKYLPLADAIAIAFVMPFLLLLMGKFLLGEEVGPQRLAACAVGFVGTLMVVQPSFAEVGAPALLPLGVALTFSLFMLVTRRIAKEIDPIGMQAVSGWIAVAVLAPLLLITNAAEVPGMTLPMPPRDAWGLLLLIGLLGSFGHLLMTWSLRFAPSATLAPMQYLEIPCATLIGWAIFGDLPDGLAAIGIGVTIASGLFIVARERAIARRPLPAQAPFPQALQPEE
ncbi:DMT family transporter [Pseudooceanicola aestuarii]|uniref:DMT family transporter n=1 Tax=Pseudooceanicola aestuarii TaxID=2697319 RepID=UPI0013D5FF02|nr:DMT family transporter [Pseudooceanicola aestuarii]